MPRHDAKVQSVIVLSMIRISLSLALSVLAFVFVSRQLGLSNIVSIRDKNWTVNLIVFDICITVSPIMDRICYLSYPLQNVWISSYNL